MSDTLQASVAPKGWRGKSAGVSLLLGLLFLMAGAVAILAPVKSTFAMILVVGGSLLVAGIAQIAHAFSKGWGSFFLHVLLGLGYVGVGLVFLLNPKAGALVLTSLLSWLLMIQGVCQIWLAFTARPARHWGWLALAGVVAIVAGLWLRFLLPSVAFTMPGVFLGISLLSEGLAFLLMRRA